MDNCPNPWRPGNPVYSHDIAPYLRVMKKELSFESRKELIKWLRSEEVRPCWHEFRRDYLHHHQMILRDEKPWEPCPNFTEDFFSVETGAVNIILNSPLGMARLRRDAKRGDKSQWTVEAHVAWFVSRLYHRAWNHGRDSLSRDSRDRNPLPFWHPRCFGQRPSLLTDELKEVLVCLVLIDIRQPNWIYNGEDPDDIDDEETYGAQWASMRDLERAWEGRR
jgi:hypothetical protein